ncbi:hypothetical protein [Acinetobacter baumannii]|uniref:hypothetical protein n=1 Tax=Acinetobacter baumannii TaxID=470 RepID=UPI0002CF8144|nr:hypothetical protein [Acinetobacter baumannii]ENV28402.1 hypothetical protein F961_03182 [Acinetobacter baumannii NIPH 60]
MRASAFQQTLLDYCQDYETAKSLGTAMLACNAMIVPAIAPHIALLIPNAPRPVSTYTEPTEVIFAGGLQAHRSGVPKTSHDGQLQLIETDTGQIAGFAELLMANNGHTDCIVFDGRKESTCRVKGAQTLFNNGISKKDLKPDQRQFSKDLERLI